jgi:cephalosporin hydroxylase
MMTHRRIALIACCALAVSCARKPVRPAGPPVTRFEVTAAGMESRLLRGFYESHGAWRWSAPVFAVLLDAPAAGESATLLLDCMLPAELMSGELVTISARVNGVEIGGETFTKEGRTLFRRPVPGNLLGSSPAEVEFSLSRPALPGAKGEPRGLIAVAAGFFEPNEMPEYKERILNAARTQYNRVHGAPGRGMTLEQDKAMNSLFHQTPMWTSMWFHGIPILKNPIDLWTVQQIITEVRPDFIIETGTFRGGSAIYLAHVLEGLGLTDSRVITIDIGDYCQAAAAQRLWRDYVEFKHASSTDPDLVREIGARVRGKRVLAMLDSDHSARHVMNELRAYAPMISKGSYIVAEDTHMDGVPTQPGFGPGPLAATLEFLATGGDKDFEQDRSREAFGTTYYPGGWLKRK